MTTLPGLSRETHVVVDRFTINGGRTSRTVRVPMSGLPRFVVEIQGLSDTYWSSDAQWVLRGGGNGNDPIRIFSYDAATHAMAFLNHPGSTAANRPGLPPRPAILRVLRGCGRPSTAGNRCDRMAKR